MPLFYTNYMFQFSSVAQSCPTLCDPIITARQASLSITNSRSSLKLTSIESVMPSSHLILCRPLFLLPPIPPSIRVFSNESILSHRSLRLYECFFHFFPPCLHKGSFILIYSEVHWFLLFVVFNMLLRPFRNFLFRHYTFNFLFILYK